MRVLFAGVLCTALACNDATTETVAPPRNRVLVEASTFTPSSVTVRLNGTVEFAFGSTPHSVIFDELPGRPDHIETNLSNTVEERVFTAQGTYPFSCQEHQNMRGYVVVPPPGGAGGS